MSVAQNIVASPNGWIDDCPGGVCTANETQTLGNNVLACMDRIGAGTQTSATPTPTALLDGNGRPTGNPDHQRARTAISWAPRRATSRPTSCRRRRPPRPTPRWDRPRPALGKRHVDAHRHVPPRRGDASVLRPPTGTTTNCSPWVSTSRRRTSSRTTSAASVASAGDRVLVDVQDGAGTNNANFATPPDGVSGRIADVPLHRPHHRPRRRPRQRDPLPRTDPRHQQPPGRQRRRSELGPRRRAWAKGGATSTPCRSSTTPTPTTRTDSTPRVPTRPTSWAACSTTTSTASAASPTSTNNAINPLTWADVDDVTNDMSGGIAPSPLLFNGNGGDGGPQRRRDLGLDALGGPRRASSPIRPARTATCRRATTRCSQIVTDALKQTPIDPSFTDARDALVRRRLRDQRLRQRGVDLGAGSPTAAWATAPCNRTAAVFGFIAGHKGVAESIRCRSSTSSIRTPTWSSTTAPATTTARSTRRDGDPHGHADQSLARTRARPSPAPPRRSRRRIRRDGQRQQLDLRRHRARRARRRATPSSSRPTGPSSVAASIDFTLSTFQTSAPRRRHSGYAWVPRPEPIRR